MKNIREIFARAVRAHRAGDTNEAAQLYKRVLQRDAAHPDALHMLGVIESGRGELAAAYELFQRATQAAPENANFLNNLGVTARAMGRDDEAVSAFERALAREPDHVDARCNLGNAFLARDDLSEAVRQYLMVLRIERTHKGAQNNLALAYRRQGRLLDAAALYRAMIDADASNPLALANLGAVKADLGYYGKAITYYRQALEIEPENVETLNNLGVAQLARGYTAEAEANLRRAVAIDPEAGAVSGNLGTVMRRQGRTDEAAAYYRRALDVSPDDGLRMRLATLLPVIGSSEAALETARQKMEEAVTALQQQALRIGNPVSEVGVTQFNLSYHDTNNKDLNRRIAQLYRTACPALDFVAPHCLDSAAKRAGRIKVGFVSAHFRNHAVGWCYHALLRNLSCESISVSAYLCGDDDDDLWRAIGDDVDEAVVLPNNLDGARARLAQAELDILVYTDIGMDPLTYYLAFSRLAPIQCVTNGHPDTTGLESIDYFISSSPLEPPRAHSHYSETLVALDGVLVHYTRPQPPKPLKKRLDFGLPENANLYVCPQSLFKIHPGMDRSLREILTNDREGFLVVFEGAEISWTAQLLDRWRRELGDTADRVIVLPRQPFDDFLSLLKLATVILDTWPFGGGNTTYQAFAMGTPIVTFPGRFARGRSTYALYRRMGIDVAIAASAKDYASIALRLGTDPAARETLSREINEKSDLLFDDHEAIREFAKFILSVGRPLKERD